MPLIIKSTYAGDTRRLLCDETVSFATLLTVIKTAYKLSADAPIRVTYLDVDNDVITVADESDLQVAFAASNGQSIKFQVAVNAPTPIQAHTTTALPATPSPVPEAAAAAAPSMFSSLLAAANGLRSPPPPQPQASPASAAAPSSSTSSLPSAASIAAAIRSLVSSESTLVDDVVRAVFAAIDALRVGDSAETVLAIVSTLIPQITSSPPLAQLLAALNVHADKLDRFIAPFRPLITTLSDTAVDAIKARVTTLVPIYIAALKNVDIESYVEMFRQKLEAFAGAASSAGHGLDTDAFSFGGASLIPTVLSLAAMFNNGGLAGLAGMPSPAAALFRAFAGNTGDRQSRTAPPQAASSSSSQPSSAAPEVTSNVHPGVTCDNCSGAVAGIRYKCLSCTNFDLCERCESTNTHEPTHSLLKIPPPSAIVGRHRGVICDSCGRSAFSGDRYHCNVCPDYDLCSQCKTKPAVHDAAHTFSKIAPPPPQVGGRRGGCGGGDRMRAHAHRHGHGHDSSSWRSSNTSGAQAKFIQSMTYPDGSEVAVNSVVVKTWQLTNNGTESWPVGTKLIFVRGDRSLSSEEEFVVPSAAPNQTVDVNAVLSVPAEAGHYIAYFRLADVDRNVFGPGVWADINAVAQAKNEANVSPSQPHNVPVAAAALPPSSISLAATATTTAEPYTDQLAALAAMGFHDRNRNISALTECAGHLPNTVNSLLAEHMRLRQ